MKKYMVVLLAIQVLMLSACSLPFWGGSRNEPSAIAEDQDMIYVPQSENAGNPGEDENYGVKSGLDGTAGGGWRNDVKDYAGGTGINGLDDVNPDGFPDPYGKADKEAMGDIDGKAGDSSSVQTDTGKGVAGASLQEPPAGFDPGSGSNISFTEPRRPVTVYYQDGGGCIIPMTRWIKPQPGVARAAVSLAIDNALVREELAYYGVCPVIPAGTEILGIDVRDGIAVIDFNRRILDYGSPESERNIITSIVYTMTEFDTIDKVQVLANGYPLGILKYGTDVTGPLGREDIAINADPSVLYADEGKVDIYLLKRVNTGFTYPVPVSVPSNYRITNLPELLVKQLLYTKAGDGLYSEMPDGAYLLSSVYDNGTIILNISSEFLNYGGSAREEHILKQLAYTLRQCKDVRKIKIMVDGHETELPEGTDISGGILVPAVINDVIDRQ
ncbi:MAG: GerMN domain-containing protein [Acetivibrionales bacterium]|jgi:germination protein M